MTTQVTVEAHCPEDTEVVIEITGRPDFVIQNGETYIDVVWDAQEIHVKERKKATNPLKS